MEKNNNQKDFFKNTSSQSNNSSKTKGGFISEGPTDFPFMKLDEAIETIDTDDFSAEQPEIEAEVESTDISTVDTNIQDAKKTKKGKGKVIISIVLSAIIATTGGLAYHFAKKTINGQLVTPLINSEQNIDEETEEWLSQQRQTFEDAISVKQTAKEMKIDLEKDETMADAIVELENYLYVTNEIMNLKDFETVIRPANVEGMTDTIILSTDFSTLIETYNKHKNVNITDYSMKALEKNEAIKKLAIIYNQCEDYFKGGRATECLTSSIYLACSNYCGEQLNLTSEEKATHTIEVVEATEENKNGEVYLLYGNQRVQLANTIVKHINNLENLKGSIELQGEDFALTKENLQIMTDALNTAKKIVFTYPGETCYEATIKNGKTLVLRPDIATITGKTLEEIFN